MPSTASSYPGQVANWRELLQQNQRKTQLTIVLFICQYLCVGYCLDLLFQSTMTFTGLLLITAVLTIGYTYYYRKEILLTGLDYDTISAQSSCAKKKQAHNILSELVIAANMDSIPRLCSMPSPTMNAFATGWDANSATIILTAPLLAQLPRDQLEAVIAHELSHIRHQDIRLMLVLSVLSNIMLVYLDIMLRNTQYNSAPQNHNQRHQGNHAKWFFAIIALRTVVAVINGLTLLFLSRTREYLADAGAVQLTRNNQALGAALLKIQKYNQQHSHHEQPDNYAAYRAYSYLTKSPQTTASSHWQSLWQTHPSIEKRLQALGISIKKADNSN